MLDQLRRQLPAIFTILGVVALLLAGGLYLVSGEIDRWVLTTAAIGVILLVYAVLEQPQAIRRSIGGREARYGGNTLVMTLAFIGILALVNVLAARYSARWDLTEERDFSLSAQTIQVLQRISTPVRITAFYQENQPGKEELQDLLKEYVRHTDKISYEFIDPVLKPGVAREYRVESYGTTVLEADGGGQRQTVTGSREGDITSALLKLERGAPKRIGWVNGHGERDLESFDRAGASEAKRLIEQENYKVEPLSLLTNQDVPQDMSVVILAGPRQPLLPQEQEVLNRYLERGGHLFVMIDPRSPGIPTDLLNKWGIEVGEGVVLDFQLNLQGDPLVPYIDRYAPNSIMRTVAADAARYITIFPGATMVRARPGQPDTSLQVQNIAESSGDGRSWLESDQRIDPRSVSFDEGKDVRGPIPIAVSVTKRVGAEPPPEGQTAPSTRIVAIGNSAFASNELLSFLLVPGNRDLLLNSLNWLAEDEQLIGVRSKVTRDRSLLLSGSQQNMLLYSSTLFLPLLVLAVGAYVWWSRR